uniref:NADH dehydrogenase [ubiquinone] 1 beta subcomplex subunit 5, mitochondrial n=1 Tax=Myxine glutinosa TaxID=7769 RepID=UPI00358EB071
MAMLHRGALHCATAWRPFAAALGWTCGLIPSNLGCKALVRYSSDGKRLFFIRSTRFHDSRFLRLIRNYALLTGLPALAIITYINVFIGEAELTEISEDYEPYGWSILSAHVFSSSSPFL